MDRVEIEAWVESLLSAWQVKDGEVGASRAAACFSEVVAYQETPFATTLHGQDAVKQYWLEMLSLQKNVAYSYDIVSWQNSKLVLNWRVEYHDSKSSEAISLNGLSVGLFNETGLCYDWREWWHKKI